MHFSSKFGGAGPVPRCEIRIGDVDIQPYNVVRNLGVSMDSAATMSDHVINICKAASHALWKIGKIRTLLDQSCTEKLVHAFITSRLDYCNSLLYGLPLQQIRKLQIIQNSAARLVIRKKKVEHITPVLHSLHWLPIQKRIEFKVLCIVFKVLNGCGPSYLGDLLMVRSTRRSLRSQSGSVVNLHQPIGNTAYYGDRAFSICGPRLWNALPPCLRSSHTLNSFNLP